MIAIYDNFKKNRDYVHGDYVANAFRDVSSLPFTALENEEPDGETGLNEARFFQTLKDYNGKAINVSFGTTAFFSNHATRDHWHSNLKAAFQKGLTVVLTSGNDFENSHQGSGVSYLATTPWSIDCGSAKIVNGTPKMEHYSQYHPGLSEYFMNGHSYDGNGTSFAAPRLTAFIAEIQAKHNYTLSQSELRTALNLSCKLFEHEGNWYRYLDRAYLSKPYTKGVVTTEMKVAALYRLYLNRNPDAGGFEYWVSVAKTRSIEEVAMAFKGEPEYRQPNQNKTPIIEQAQAMYHLWLNRESDDGGLAFWTEKALDNNDFRTVAREFIAGARANGEQIDERLLF